MTVSTKQGRRGGRARDPEEPAQGGRWGAREGWSVVAFGQAEGRGGRRWEGEEGIGLDLCDAVEQGRGPRV